MHFLMLTSRLSVPGAWNPLEAKVSITTLSRPSFSANVRSPSIVALNAACSR